MATTTTNTTGTNIQKPQVLVLQPIFEAFESAISTKYDLLKSFESPLPLNAFLSTHSHCIKAMITLGPVLSVDASLLDQLSNLGFVCASSAGVNHIDLEACRQRGVAVTNAGDRFSADTSDYAVGLLIDVLRRVSMADRYVRNGLWPVKGDYYPLVSKVGGRRVGIVGLGNIGSHTAKRLEAFGCSISYFSRSLKPNFPSYKYFSNVLDLAKYCDVLVLTTALTAQTRHIIDRNVMSALGKDGIIINVGRGALVDEPELVRCLKEGVIGGAGLDVFVNEPGVPVELFEMENVVLSDHRSVTTPESFQGVLELVIANLDAFFAGEPLLSPVSY